MKHNTLSKSIWDIKYFPPFSSTYTAHFLVSSSDITEEYLIDLYLTKITNPDKVTYDPNKTLYTICFYHALIKGHYFNKGSLGYDVSGPNCVSKGNFIFEKINTTEPSTFIPVLS